jgi:2-phosphosulfolactate phosphatase
MNPFDQHDFAVRFGWGGDGLNALQRDVSVVVVVDVLSFSTCVDVVTSRGASVLPYRWRDDGVAEFARQHNAVVAGERGTPGAWSLSPASLMAIPPETRLVLPSPNGSTLVADAAEAGCLVVVGCLRNATRVGREVSTLEPPIAVIAAGERWTGPESRLRPAVEDQIGAGAIIAAAGLGSRSPEADAAVAVFEAASHRLLENIRSSESGRELSQRGFDEDVAIAADHDSSASYPVLEDGSLSDRADPRVSRISDAMRPAHVPSPPRTPDT